MAAFSALRELEQWLHRHIFKVGWLLTRNFQTTTILYYTFFLPGLFVNQLLIWLVAGVLDVRAERAVTWPEKQEIGSLRLDFVRVAKKINPVKAAIIEIAPLLGAIFIVWFVANNILNVSDAFASTDSNISAFANLGAAINRLTAVPAFWLWVYFIFTVTNAMMPDPKVLRGWSWGIAVFTGIVGFLFLIGFGNDAINAGFFEPIINGLNGLTGVFAFMIMLDLAAVAFLGILESTIEWITGASATFENGKMVTMTRQEAIERRRASRKQSAPAALRAPSSSSGQIPALSGQPSIYKFDFPTPGPPGREPISQSADSILEADDTPVKQPPLFNRQPRIQPDIVTTTASRTSDEDTEDTEVTPATKQPQLSPLARSGGPVIRTPSTHRQAHTPGVPDEEEDDDDDDINKTITADTLLDDELDDDDDITYEDFENPA